MKNNTTCKDCSRNLQICTCTDDTINMKQETLEEASIDYSKMYFSENKKAELGFIAGASWQKEQDKNKCSEIIDLFITEIKNEFKDDNWDYLEFIKERVIKNKFGIMK